MRHERRLSRGNGGDGQYPWPTLLPGGVVDHGVKQIPPAWLEDDEDALVTLLKRLMGRRRRVPDLIEACVGDG